MEKDERRPLDSAVVAFINDINARINQLPSLGFGPRPDLTAAQRKRLQGSGIRRYGFIDKVLDISETNMQFAPGTFNRGRLNVFVGNIEALRNIRIVVKQLLDAVDDYLLTFSDEAYRISLMYYNTVRDLARHGDNGAREVFNTLRPFFSSRRMPVDAEPTDKEIVRDVKALLRGTKEGKVEVVSDRAAARLAARSGQRVLVDETAPTRTRSAVNAVKATGSASAAEA